MKRIFAILMACLFMVAMMLVMAAPAFAANPHAGDSGKFKGSANPCKQGNAQKCPPHGPG